MYFWENDVRLNDDSEKWQSGECRSEEKTFGWMSIRGKDIRQNDFRLNNVSWNWRSAKSSRYRFDSRKWYYIVSVIALFGNMTIRPTDIRRHDVSGKWCVPEWLLYKFYLKHLGLQPNQSKWVFNFQINNFGLDWWNFLISLVPSTNLMLRNARHRPLVPGTIVLKRDNVSVVLSLFARHFSPGSLTHGNHIEINQNFSND